MAVNLLFNEIPQFLNANGAPLSGGLLFFYAAGSSTKQDTFTTLAGTVPNANPMVLDSSGRTSQAIWGTTGLLYKIGLAVSTETDPPSNFIWTLDNVSAILSSTITVSEWQASGFTPTYISATSFSVPGDQTSVLQVGRRLKILDSGGTKYATITASVFGALTTVTVAVDSAGSLATPVSAVSYSILSASNPSVGSDIINRSGNSVVSAATTNIWATNGNEIHITGSTGPITSFGTAGYAGNRRLIIFDSTPTITAGANLQIQGVASGSSVTVAANDRWEVVADTTTSMLVTRFPATGASPVLPLLRDYIDGFTLTTASTTTYDIAAGQAADSTNVAMFTGGALTAKSQSAWAVGSSAGAKLSAAALANNTWYYWFALLKDTDGTVDYGFDVATTPTLPTGYTKYRYLGARKTALAVTTWDTFIQHGDQVTWSTPPALDLSNATVSNANRTLQTVNVPAVKVEWLGQIHSLATTGITAVLLTTDPAAADVAVSAAMAANLSDSIISNTTATTLIVGGPVRCWTNTSSQIGIREQNAAGQHSIQTRGWTDPRGKPV